MFTEEEKNFILGILSQLQFKIGQIKELQLAESIINKLKEVEHADSEARKK